MRDKFQQVPFICFEPQLKTAIASLKSAQASFEQFALNTQDQEAKTSFTNAAQQAQKIVDEVNPRVEQIEQEEPQYKGF